MIVLSNNLRLGILDSLLILNLILNGWDKLWKWLFGDGGLFCEIDLWLRFLNFDLWALHRHD